MTTKFVKDVREFQDTFKVNKDNQGRLAAVLRTRKTLLKEEYQETIDALDLAIQIAQKKSVLGDHAMTNSLVPVLDGIIDLMYIAIGLGDSIGMDIDGAWKEVHGSNMTKLDDEGNPIFRADGKILKGPNFKEPELQQFVPTTFE